MFVAVSRVRRHWQLPWWTYIGLGGPFSFLGLLYANVHPALAFCFIVPFMPAGVHGINKNDGVETPLEAAAAAAAAGKGGGGHSSSSGHGGDGGGGHAAVEKKLVSGGGAPSAAEEAGDDELEEMEVRNDMVHKDWAP